MRTLLLRSQQRGRRERKNQTARYFVQDITNSRNESQTSGTPLSPRHTECTHATAELQREEAVNPPMHRAARFYSGHPKKKSSRG